MWLWRRLWKTSWYITSAKKYILSKLRISIILCPVNPYLSIGHDRDRIDHCDATIINTYLTISVPIKCFKSILYIIHTYSWKQNNATCYRCCYRSRLNINIFSVDAIASTRDKNILVNYSYIVYLICNKYISSH